MTIVLGVMANAACVHRAQSEVLSSDAMCHAIDSDESTRWWWYSAARPMRKPVLVDYEASGECAQAEVRRTFEQRVSGLHYCIERWRPAGTDERRYFDVSWRILSDGSAHAMATAPKTDPDQKVAGCMQRQVARWMFKPVADRHAESKAAACEVKVTLMVQGSSPVGGCERSQLRDSPVRPSVDQAAYTHILRQPRPGHLKLPLGLDGRRVLPDSPSIHTWPGRRHGRSGNGPRVAPQYPACFATPRILANAVIDALHQGDLDAFDALFAFDDEVARTTDASLALACQPTAPRWVALTTAAAPYSEDTSHNGSFRELRNRLQQLGATRPEVLELRAVRDGQAPRPVGAPLLVCNAPLQDIEATLELVGSSLVLEMAGVFVVDRGYVLSGLRLRDAQCATD